jgi:hypothetical protein
MVIVMGPEIGSDRLVLLECFFLEIEMVLCWVAARFKSSSAACWMKVWPSSQKGLTNFSTFSELVITMWTM